jgi:cytochrome c oxidase subunit I+III
LLFVINVVSSLLKGEAAPMDPWGGGGLEWATTSPPQPYNFERLPVVESRYPLWDAPASIATYEFKENPERRETLGTTALDAEPEMRVFLAGNSIIPFLLALSVTALLIGTMFDIKPVAIFTVVSLVLLAVWHWPKGQEWSMEWARSGPEDALPISITVKHKKPPTYYGILLFILIEAVEFAAFIATYFYLRSTTNDWPPGDWPYPELLLPTLGTFFMLASVIPTYLGDQAIKKNDQRGLVRNLILTLVLEAVFVSLLAIHLESLNFDWRVNAYASIYWMLILTHLTFTVVMILENVYVLVLAWRGFYNDERHWGVEVDGLSSYFVAGAWAAIYLTVFISPYLF